MTKEEDLSKYMALIEHYKEQMGSLDMQLQYIQGAINEYARAKLTLEQMDNSKKDSDLLLPIGGGTYVYSKANETSKVLFDVGGGYITEKKTKEAIKNIEKRIKELEGSKEKVTTIIQQMQSEATDVSFKAQKIINEQQGK